MTVSIEPLRIGKDLLTYIVIRQVGRHKDIEESGDTTDQAAAVRWAARRWGVHESEVTVLQEAEL